ncbi:MAG: P-loop NTPase [Spirochaetota bacterium]
MQKTGEQRAADRQRAEQDLRLERNLADIGHRIIVLSGKGGVGKTSVAVNLAYALSLEKKMVGLLDVDVHGPDIAKMLGIEQARLAGTREGIEPVHVLPTLRAVSLALVLSDPDQPVIWRGPLKMATIKQFLSDVHWGKLDYLVVDSPPGTGDEPLSVCQLIPGVSGAVVVTTPQDVAILDARKCVGFARQLDIPVIGIVENMSGFTCPHCGKEVALFKKGGGERAASQLGVPFLGSIPFEQEMVDLADRGTPFVAFGRELRAARAFRNIVENINRFLAQSEDASHP